MVFNYYYNNIVAGRNSDSADIRESYCFVEIVSDLKGYMVNREAIISDEEASRILGWEGGLGLVLSLWW